MFFVNLSHTIPKLYISTLTTPIEIANWLFGISGLNSLIFVSSIYFPAIYLIALISLKFFR